MKAHAYFVLILTFIAFIALILCSGCKEKLSEDRGLKEGTKELELCMAACLSALAKNQSLENGPCLLDPIENSDWVCDIAHWPREQVDNLRENQCNAWHNGTAKHFIELTPECKFIRAL
ncbi:MAG: hypothetical protein QXE64_01605 [Candidatus Pacearchaeota archaeon]